MKTVQCELREPGPLSVVTPLALAPGPLLLDRVPVVVISAQLRAYHQAVELEELQVLRAEVT